MAVKILHVETGKHLYGGALQVFYLMRGLQVQGVENVLVCPEGSEIGRAAAGFARVIELPVAGDVDPRLFLGLVAAIRRERPDLVHAHSRRGADWWSGLAAKLLGVKSLVTRRVDNREPSFLAKLKYGLYDQVVSISEGIRQVLLSEGVPPEKIALIHSAVDIDRYSQPADRDWFAEEFQLRPGEKVVGVIAQLIARKGHRFLIEAAPEILRQCPQTRFIFFGQGPLRQQLEELCREQGVSHKFIIAGFRDDMHRVLPCLDVLVHPAQMEGLGVSLLQASAAGVPIVAGRAGGIPEVVMEGVNGYLLEPTHFAGLAERVLHLLRDAALSRQLGDGGRQHVRKFSISEMVKSYDVLYSSLIRTDMPQP